MTAKNNEAWPALPLDEWQDTYATLHMWSQVVGKVRLALAPPVNHWWHVALYVTARGLTTSAIPYRGGAFEIYVMNADGSGEKRLTKNPTTNLTEDTAPAWQPLAARK